MPEKVVIIDDAVEVAAALTIRLRAAGYDVVTASDGVSGLEAVATHHPDVVLLDIRMPGMDGFEVNRRLKADPRLASIPVIFLSANVQEPARQQAMSGGAVAFLSKPYKSTEVLATIARVCAASSTAIGDHT